MTTQFSGLVVAYDDQSEEAFLTTQQVDEARHAQHFNRFYEQVLRYDGTFEERLDDVPRAPQRGLPPALRRAPRRGVPAAHRHPRDVEAKVDFVTTYHMVIEGTLALTGQYFITDCCEDEGLLPGFLEGFRRISQDEHRHVAYGTWYLQQKASDPALARRIQDKLMRAAPGRRRRAASRPATRSARTTSTSGYSSEDMNEFAFTALTRRLKVIGVGLPAVAA